VPNKSGKIASIAGSDVSRKTHREERVGRGKFDMQAGEIAIRDHSYGDYSRVILASRA